MHILWIGTKPPYPPDDGGRLVTWLTLQELQRRGHRITFLAPALERGLEADEQELRTVCRPILVPASLPDTMRSLARSVLLRLPVTAARHRHPALRRRIQRLLTDPSDAPDVVHVEQLQAFCFEPCRPVPTVLRAQNVESDLWRGAARVAAGPRRLLLALEAQRVARHEARTLALSDAALALTHRDARRLSQLSGRNVIAAPPPFPARLPPRREPLAGDPPLVVLGAAGWLPNRDGTAWLLQQVWRTVHRVLPDAILHLFGWEGHGRLGEGIVLHPSPRSSADAFAPGSVLLVPLRIASGVRMKILEAWARGIPVVATEEAAAGLVIQPDRELLVATDGDGFADRLRRLQDPALRQALIAAGRAYLRRHHDPSERTESLLRIYEDLRASTPRRHVHP